MKVAERSHARFPENESARQLLARAKLARDGDLKAVLELAPDSREGMIARFVQGELDALQRPLDPSGFTDWVGRVKISLAQAELLLAGRDAAAQAVLEPYTKITQGVLARLASMPAHDKAFTHAFAANWAALLGEPVEAREHLAQALAAPPSDDRASFFHLLSATERHLGNAEAAWMLIQPYVGSGEVDSLSHGELRAFKAFYDKVYGESPSYRAYVAKIATEKK